MSTTVQTLETPRLILRPFQAADRDALAAILADPITMAFWPTPLTRDRADAWLNRTLTAYAERGWGRLAVTLRDSGELIGDCGISQVELDGNMENDLGYIVHHPFWNQRLGTEAARACLAHGFEALHLPRVCANMPVDHLASRRVAEHLGMRLEKEFRNSRNRDLPTCLYSLSAKPEITPS